MSLAKSCVSVANWLKWIKPSELSTFSQSFVTRLILIFSYPRPQKFLSRSSLWVKLVICFIDSKHVIFTEWRSRANLHANAYGVCPVRLHDLSCDNILSKKDSGFQWGQKKTAQKNYKAWASSKWVSLRLKTIFFALLSHLASYAETSLRLRHEPKEPLRGRLLLALLNGNHVTPSPQPQGCCMYVDTDIVAIRQTYAWITGLNTW